MRELTAEQALDVWALWNARGADGLAPRSLDRAAEAMTASFGVGPLRLRGLAESEISMHIDKFWRSFGWSARKYTFKRLMTVGKAPTYVLNALSAWLVRFPLPDQRMLVEHHRPSEWHPEDEVLTLTAVVGIFRPYLRCQDEDKKSLQSKLRRAMINRIARSPDGKNEIVFIGGVMHVSQRWIDRHLAEEKAKNREEHKKARTKRVPTCV